MRGDDPALQQVLKCEAAELGPSDALAVIDFSNEEDLGLVLGVQLGARVTFPDRLQRDELADFVRNMDHSDEAFSEVQSAIWQCAVAEWRGFVESLDSNRVAQRDALLEMSRAIAEEATREGGLVEPRLLERYSSLVIRVQTERAAKEERFILEVANCAQLALLDRPQPADAEARIHSSAIVHDVLAPLIARARIRNTSEFGDWVRFRSRSDGVDLRAIVRSCDATALMRDDVKETLARYDEVRMSMLRARFRAVWRAAGRATGFRAATPDWRTVEVAERQLRSALRTTVSRLREVLAPEADQFLLPLLALRVMRAAYPEFDAQIVGIQELMQERMQARHRVVMEAQSATGGANAGADDGTTSMAARWFEVDLVVRSAMSELDTHHEALGFLSDVDGSLEIKCAEIREAVVAQLDELVEKLRADLEAEKQRRP